jgi:hypothetical protein
LTYFMERKCRKWDSRDIILHYGEQLIPTRTFFCNVIPSMLIRSFNNNYLIVQRRALQDLIPLPWSNLAGPSLERFQLYESGELSLHALASPAQPDPAPAGYVADGKNRFFLIVFMLNAGSFHLPSQRNWIVCSRGNPQLGLNQESVLAHTWYSWTVRPEVGWHSLTSKLPPQCHIDNRDRDLVV